MPNPKYSLHKNSGLARVIVHGKHVFLGRYNSAESLAAYERICAELEAQAPNESDITLGRLSLLFMDHAHAYYRRPDGEPTNEADNFRCALKYVCREMPTLKLRHFGPKKLQQLRSVMIDAGLSRQTINAHVRRIRQVVKWGVSQELTVPAVLEALRSVEPLKQGRTTARESEGRSMVDVQRVEAVRPFLSRAVCGLVDFMLHTGCRPGEAVQTRWSEINTDGDVWEYRPERHKTKHKGKGRVIQVGPKAQQVLNNLRELSRSDFVFDPQMAVDEFSRRAYGEHARPRKVGEHYSVASLLSAVRTGCERAFDCPPELRLRSLIKRLPGESARQHKKRRQQAAEWRKDNCWCPGQLRHTTATLVRQHSDLEAAQQVLGHSSKTTTERYYAELDQSRARVVAAELG